MTRAITRRERSALPGTCRRSIASHCSSSIGPSYWSAMPTQYAGMLFMKKFAKCSAATTISASGLVASRAPRSSPSFA